MSMMKSKRLKKVNCFVTNKELFILMGKRLWNNTNK